jgi:hypothetical protein
MKKVNMNHAQANTRQATYQPSGTTLQIYWDEREKHRITDEGTETYFEYRICTVPVTSNRGQIIEAIIATQYTTGAEFAAINNGGEQYEVYMAFRETAKALADGWINRSEDDGA